MRAPGRLTALYAILVKEYHLTLPDIYDLTPRQIQDVYLHPRDDKGMIQMPAEATATQVEAAPASPADRLAKLYRIQAMLTAGFAKATPEATAELDRRIKELEQHGQPG